MRPHLRLAAAGIAMTVIAEGPMMTSASAITVEVARKCDALVAKAFPPREVGNPAAGSAKGSGLAQQDYFRKCVANGGNTDDAPKQSK